MAATTWLPAELLRDTKFEGHKEACKWVDRCLGEGAYAGLVVHEELLGIALVVEHKHIGDCLNDTPRIACRVDFTNGDYIKKMVG